MNRSDEFLRGVALGFSAFAKVPDLISCHMVEAMEIAEITLDDLVLGGMPDDDVVRIRRKIDACEASRHSQDEVRAARPKDYDFKRSL